MCVCVCVTVSVHLCACVLVCARGRARFLRASYVKTVTIHFISQLRLQGPDRKKNSVDSDRKCWNKFASLVPGNVRDSENTPFLVLTSSQDFAYLSLLTQLPKTNQSK